MIDNKFYIKKIIFNIFTSLVILNNTLFLSSAQYFKPQIDGNHNNDINKKQEKKNSLDNNKNSDLNNNSVINHQDWYLKMLDLYFWQEKFFKYFFSEFNINRNDIISSNRLSISFDKNNSYYMDYLKFINNCVNDQLNREPICIGGNFRHTIIKCESLIFPDQILGKFYSYYKYTESSINYNFWLINKNDLFNEQLMQMEGFNCLKRHFYVIFDNELEYSNLNIVFHFKSLFNSIFITLGNKKFIEGEYFDPSMSEIKIKYFIFDGNNKITIKIIYSLNIENYISKDPLNKIINSTNMIESDKLNKKKVVFYKSKNLEKNTFNIEGLGKINNYLDFNSFDGEGFYKEIIEISKKKSNFIEKDFRVIRRGIFLIDNFSNSTDIFPQLNLNKSDFFIKNYYLNNSDNYQDHVNDYSKSLYSVAIGFFVGVIFAILVIIVKVICFNKRDKNNSTDINFASVSSLEEQQRVDFIYTDYDPLMPVIKGVSS